MPNNVTKAPFIAIPYRSNGPENRVLHAIQVNLRAKQTLYIVVWPERPADRARLLNSKRTWFTARTGDVVTIAKENTVETDRFFIESIQLFLAYPVSYNGVFVRTAQEWLDGVPAIHKSTLGLDVDGIPCDRRGYVPTVMTGPFDLDWDHGSEHTHYFDGMPTPYGKWWEGERWPEIVAEACRFTHLGGGSVRR